LPHISNATGFDLFREINGSGTWTEIQPGISSTTTTYTDAAVSNGDTYIYLLTPYVTVSGIKITGANADSNTLPCRHGNAISSTGSGQAAANPTLGTSSGTGSTVGADAQTSGGRRFVRIIRGIIGG
jgi:hypothetical protein